MQVRPELICVRRGESVLPETGNDSTKQRARFPDRCLLSERRVLYGIRPPARYPM